MSDEKGENALSRFAVTSAEPASFMSPAEWADVGSERLIVGSIILFHKGEFLQGSSRTVMSQNGLFLVLSARQSWVKWLNLRPVRHVAYSSKNGPVRDQLGDPEEGGTWENGSDGKLRDCWQLTWYMTIVDCKTGEHSTFTTNTAYGSLAVDELVGQIRAMNWAKPGAVPIIRLEACLQPNRQWGKVQAPRFVIVGWKGGTEPPPAPKPKLAIIESGRKPAPVVDPLDDEPF